MKKIMKKQILKVDSPKYKNVVQKLLGNPVNTKDLPEILPQIPIEKTEKIDFTGNKDVDTLILLSLNDKDLVNVCKVNKNFRKLCKDDIFWLNRTFNRFSSIITKEELKTYKNKFNT